MLRKAICLAVALTALTAPAQARNRFDIRVLAHVPPPGYPALSLVAPNRNIYVGTFTDAGGNNTGPSKVFAFGPRGKLKRTYTIQGQTPGKVHGVQVAAIDAKGRLYLLDQHPARVVRLDPATGKQTTYATFRDVPPCLPGASGDCSATTTDNEPEPDYAAWGSDGSLYVTDYTQGLIWRVSPRGGQAKIWLTDPRFDGSMFGVAGIVLMPDHRTLMVSTSAGPVVGVGDPTTGKLYTLPILPNGKPGALKKIWESGPREGPDGFALAASGHIYLALVGPGANQIVEIAPDGHEIARAPTPTHNTQMPVPFDSPSSVQFDGTRMIVTNDAYFSGDQSHMVVFDVFAGERGQPVFVPGSGKKRYTLAVSPRTVGAGQRRLFSFHARVSGRSLARATIRFAGRKLKTNSHGRVALRLTLHDPGIRTARLEVGGRTVAKATVRVRAGD